MTRIFTFLLASMLSGHCVAAPPPNILFIAIDDLRPSLGCYGDSIAKTPNIDAIARRGFRFEKAYCQQSVCAVSRLSLLTGQRPDTIEVWDLSTSFRKKFPDLVTLPQLFKQNGYYTRSVGKVFHGSGPASLDPPSWTAPPILDGRAKKRYVKQKIGNQKLKQASYESVAVEDTDYTDGLVTAAAVKILKSPLFKESPFFLAVGFRKPHLPFNAPKKYWDLYDRSQFKPPSNQLPLKAPEIATRSWLELEGYQDIPKNLQKDPLNEEKIKLLHHGYYACISYIDHQIGQILRELKEQALSNNTIIVVWSDHGYHLGEQGLWTKGNNYELSTRVPLIISDPRMESQGAASQSIVELLDIYPTLIELGNLNSNQNIQGASLVPLLQDPSTLRNTMALSQWPRDRFKNRHRGHGDIMGYSLRTKRYRYIEWRDWKSSKPLKRELYDHQKDPEEMLNIANEAGNTQLIISLRAKLNKKLN